MDSDVSDQPLPASLGPLAEPLAESLPVPEVVRKPKRLTLQERLALASKKKKKAQEAEAQKAAAKAEVQEGAAEAVAEPLAPQQNVNEPSTEDQGEPEPAKSDVATEDLAAIESVQESVKAEANGEAKLEPKAPAKADTRTPPQTPPRANGSAPDLSRGTAALKATVAQLRDENTRLRTKNTEKVLAEKDALIEQLMSEGQELSRKELKANERIRALVATNAKLEASLVSYSEKNEELLLKLGEIEDLIKVHKVSSVEQLIDVISAANARAAELQAQLDREKSNNWEAKYKEAQRLYERELDDKKKVQKELSETAVQLDLLQTQARLDLELKEKLISDLRREAMAAKDENSVEISRLELKLEDLRMENESVLKSAKRSDDDSADASKLVDYDDYMKLSSSHRNLQTQYVLSQENWKLIESNLLNKVDTITRSVETLKKSKTKTMAELKKLNGKIQTQADEIEALEAENGRLREEISDRDLQIQVKIKEISQLEDKLDELKTVFNSDRQNYDLKIKALNDTILDYDSRTPVFPSMSSDNLNTIQNRRGMREAGLAINMEPRPQRRTFLSHLILNSVMGTPSYPWEEPQFPDARNNLLYEQQNSSLVSLGEMYLNEALEAGDQSMSLPVSSGATKNIQLINKMSLTIRRMELELMTLKEENEELSTQKNCAQQEIVNRAGLQEQVEQLEAQLAELQRELEQRERKEETLLEVIGEKSEVVEELRADVADLKELLREQVKQMIGMHK